MRRIRAGVLVFLALAAGTLSAYAQVSGSVSVVSDYRYRGVSLSDGQPAVQASAAYDHPGGWYGGLFGSTARLPGNSAAELQLLPYLGYAHALRPGLSWDAGAAYVAFTGGDYAYPDLYVGVASDHLSLRVHYDFRYFGQSSGALYADFNAARPITDHLQLIAHAGVLRLTEPGAVSDGSDPVQLDFRIGLGLDLRAVEVQLTWEGTNGASRFYPFADDGSATTAFVLGLSRSF